jgi:hypothetical protein
MQMFQPYWNSTIRESIQTQDEEDMVREILAINTLQEWNEAYAAFRLACLKPAFRASHERFVTEKALLVRQRELSPHVPQHVAETACCVGEPPQRGLLGELFHDIMSDYYAYSHIDPNGPGLPSQQYLQQKAIGSVVWDLLLGRR